MLRRTLACVLVLAEFAFVGVWGPDTVRVTNGHFALAYNVAHVTEPALALRPPRPGAGIRPGLATGRAR